MVKRELKVVQVNGPHSIYQSYVVTHFTINVSEMTFEIKSYEEYDISEDIWREI